MNSTPDDNESTRTEWVLVEPHQNSGTGWKLIQSEDLTSLRLESFGTSSNDEMFFPAAYLDQLIAAFQTAYLESSTEEWDDKEWRFSIGGGDLVAFSQEGSYGVALSDLETGDKLRFTPLLFDVMYPGLNEARHELTEEVDTSDEVFEILYQQDEKDHVLHNDEQVCPHDTWEGNNTESKPIDSLTERESRLITNGESTLCSYCQRFLEKNELLDGKASDELPPFTCPACGDKAMVVRNLKTGGEIEHKDGTKHEFDFSIYEQWRRGKESAELSN